MLLSSTNNTLVPLYTASIGDFPHRRKHSEDRHAFHHPPSNRPLATGHILTQGRWTGVWIGCDDLHIASGHRSAAAARSAGPLRSLHARERRVARFGGRIGCVLQPVRRPEWMDVGSNGHVLLLRVRVDADGARIGADVVDLERGGISVGRGRGARPRGSRTRLSRDCRCVRWVEASVLSLFWVTVSIFFIAGRSCRRRLGLLVDGRASCAGARRHVFDGAVVARCGRVEGAASRQ